MPTRKGSKNVIQNKHTLRDVYVKYTKEVVKKSKYDITKKEFLKIATSLLKNMLHHMIMESGEVKLNHGLGTLSIKKIKTNYERPKIDYKQTNLLGKTVYFLNLHTQGYYIRFYWSKWARTKVAGKIPYCFRPHRINTRLVSNLFSTGQKDYFE